jgi:hypothetical protein
VYSGSFEDDVGGHLQLGLPGAGAPGGAGDDVLRQYLGVGLAEVAGEGGALVAVPPAGVHHPQRHTPQRGLVGRPVRGAQARFGAVDTDDDGQFHHVHLPKARSKTMRALT